jgi:DNA-binding XRE family transcriptional regulator
MDLGLLQHEVAAQLGVDKFTVLNWERGKTAPDVRYYPAIITFLGYNPLPQGATFPETRASWGWDHELDANHMRRSAS